jgi:hypothetical protein
MLLKDLVPGSRSDRLSVHEEPEEADHMGPGRPVRGTSPPTLEARTRSRESTARKIAGGSLPDSWTSVDMTREAKGDGAETANPLTLLCTFLSGWVGGKVRAILSCRDAGLLELMFDPFANTRVVSKKGKINTHRGSQQKGLAM